LILLFMGITGFIAFMILMAPPPAQESRSQGGIFEDTRSGQEVQTQVMGQHRERVDRSDSVEMARTVDGVPTGPRQESPAPLRARTQPPSRPAPAVDDSLLKKTFRGWSDTKAAELGAKKGLLSKLAERMIKHPKVVEALFNNKLVVDAFMSRSTVKKNCGSTQALNNLLTGSSSAGMRDEKLGLVKTFLGSPASARAFAGSRMAKAVMGCPSMKGLMNDTGSMGRIVAANPGYMELMNNPVLTQSLAENPAALSMYEKGSTSLGF